MPTSTGQGPQPMPAPANPSRPVPRKMSTTGSALRLPSYSQRTGASPMSFGAAMSGVSFTNGGGGGGYSYGRGGPGSYGARFYGDSDSPHMFDSTPLPFGQSVNMDGSFAASSAAFGLMGSSYTRRSYAAAAGGRDYSPAMLSTSLASLTTNPMGSLSHSYSRGQLETLMARRNEAEYTKEYDCCGVKHHGLHALLEHVEDQHPYSDPSMPEAGGFSPVTLAMDLDLEVDPENVPSTTNSTRSSTSPRPMPNYPLTPTTSTSAPKNDPPQPAPPSAVAPLQLSDVLKSPSGGEAASLPKAGSAGQMGAEFGVPPKFAGAGRGGAFLGGPKKTGQQRFDRAFNEVVAGKAGSLEDPNKPPGPTAVAPSVLFTSAKAMGMPQASSVVGRREGTTGSAAPSSVAPSTTAPAVTSPTTATAETKKEGSKTPTEEKEAPPPPPGTASPAPSANSSTANGVNKSVDPPLPPPSLFTTHKAWRCPNPGCNKAYKQSNGLKYHLQKGQCDFAIHDAIDHGLTLEEAEERARPYVCAVGAGCNKRYRQMNGLKYHYLNSGEHGQYGLRMLQNGTHPHPPTHPPVPKRDRAQVPRNNGEFGATRAAPYAVPQRPNAAPAQSTPATTTSTTTTAAPVPAAAPVTNGPRMGTWPTQPRPVANGTSPASGPIRHGAHQHHPTHAQTTAASVVANKPAPVPAATAVPKMPVQRGRDAVLFSNLDSLDV